MVITGNVFKTTAESFYPISRLGERSNALQCLPWNALHHLSRSQTQDSSISGRVKLTSTAKTNLVSRSYARREVPAHCWGALGMMD